MHVRNRCNVESLNSVVIARPKEELYGISKYKCKVITLGLLSLPKIILYELVLMHLLGGNGLNCLETRKNCVHIITLIISKEDNHVLILDFFVYKTYNGILRLKCYLPV